MAHITLTAQQKLNLGLLLSASDIRLLLNDRNSLIFKMYNDCLIIAAITEENFIHLIQILLCEHALERKQLIGCYRRHQLLLERDELNYFFSLSNYDEYIKPEKYTLPYLQESMKALLNISQYGLSINELLSHHQLITTNFNNQISAILGSTITLPLTPNKSVDLRVPQSFSRPFATTPQLLKHSPTMRNKLQADEKLAITYTRHLTFASTGYLAAINKWGEILEYNRETLIIQGIDVNTIFLTPTLLKQIDESVKSCLDMNKGLIDTLLENNTYTIKYTIKKALHAEMVLEKHDELKLSCPTLST